MSGLWLTNATIKFKRRSCVSSNSLLLNNWDSYIMLGRSCVFELGLDGLPLFPPVALSSKVRFLIVGIFCLSLSPLWSILKSSNLWLGAISNKWSSLISSSTISCLGSVLNDCCWNFLPKWVSLHLWALWCSLIISVRRISYSIFSIIILLRPFEGLDVLAILFRVKSPSPRWIWYSFLLSSSLFWITNGHNFWRNLGGMPFLHSCSSKNPFMSIVPK